MKVFAILLLCFVAGGLAAPGKISCCPSLYVVHAHILAIFIGLALERKITMEICWYFPITLHGKLLVSQATDIIAIVAAFLKSPGGCDFFCSPSFGVFLLAVLLVFVPLLTIFVMQLPCFARVTVVKPVGTAFSHFVKSLRPMETNACSRPCGSQALMNVPCCFLP